ncbi:MAG: methylenetetrahydrofolate reductase [Pseudomonadota bacterium]|nr:methylenetetrahydrofolate reductase [Pseudomonadota bacterium]
MSEQIKLAMQNWSIEFTPSNKTKIDDFRHVLPIGTTVNVTAIPGSDPAWMLSTVEQLAAQEMNPVPHIAARGIASNSALEKMLASYREVDVTEILLIAGGYKSPVGDFKSTIEVLETGLFQHMGIRKVGVAGHPEGSPDIPEPELKKALKQKNHFAKEAGLEMYLETQFCFEAQAILRWESEIRADGNQLPIRVGLAGPAQLKTLLHFALISGVGPSLQFLKKQARHVTTLLSVQDPYDLIADLAPHVNKDSPTQLQSLHFYSFGDFSQTARFAYELAMSGTR